MLFVCRNRWDVILPLDFHIFQRGRYTTNQYIWVILPMRDTHKKGTLDRKYEQWLRLYLVQCSTIQCPHSGCPTRLLCLQCLPRWHTTLNVPFVGTSCSVMMTCRCFMANRGVTGCSHCSLRDSSTWCTGRERPAISLSTTVAYVAFGLDDCNPCSFTCARSMDGFGNLSQPKLHNWPTCTPRSPRAAAVALCSRVDICVLFGRSWRFFCCMEVGLQVTLQLHWNRMHYDATFAMNFLQIRRHLLDICMLHTALLQPLGTKARITIQLYEVSLDWMWFMCVKLFWPQWPRKHNISWCVFW